MTDIEFARARERADAAADRARHRVVGVITASIAVLLATGWSRIVELVAA